MPGKFVHRVRKQKAKARLQDTNPNPRPTQSADSNVAEIIPSEQTQRRAELQAEIKAQHGTQVISGKKRKRLDHYIETKLRKEENLELLKKLSEHKVDTSLLRSSKNLGRGSDTRRETLSRALQESALGLNEEQNADILLEKRRPAKAEHSPELESEAEDTAGPLPVSNGTSDITPSRTFGSGLKRPLEIGQDGLPQIKQRKRKKVVAAQLPDLGGIGSDDDDVSDPEAWNGFSEGEENAGTQAEVASNTSEEDDEDSEIDSESDSNSEAESDSDADSDSEGDNKKRVFDFKQWAEQQRNQAIGFVPSSNAAATDQQKQDLSHIQYVPKPFDAIAAPAVGPLSRPEVGIASVVVPRSDEIQDARLKLPVVQEEQKIMETINNNAITVVCGATGSGKTTQVPQMMFESGYGSAVGETTKDMATKDKTRGLIGVTQPRRVAATSVAARVKVEMGGLGYRVGHQVRFDATVGFRTAIKFMTDGILLREVAHDFLLSKYSAIVIDEAHERSVNTDILIGLLSRIVDLRAELSVEKPEKIYPLKLVIMSATMRVQDFTSNPVLFRHGAPPIVQAEGRQFPVVDHFARVTQQDYLEEMFRKVCKGHKKLPRGGMLVFLTGQEEIHVLKRRLQQALAPSSSREHRSSFDKDDYLEGLSDEEDAEFDVEDIDDADYATPRQLEENVHILPLYSQLPDNQQAKVFEPPPEGSRLLILATNVAETSLTIPGIRYVFDCGRVKQKQYDVQTGVQTFDVGWISKASASQRAGRAGRTGPGHCYRLYSSAVYERDFEEYTVPEILRTSVEGVALMVKGVDFPNVANFPFPTPPDRYALSKAEELLRHLGAIDARGKISDIGRQLLHYPVNPRYGRMLALAATEGMLAHTIAIVSALAVPELLMSPHQAVLSLSKDDDNSEHSDDKDSAEKLRPWKRAQTKLSQWDTHCDAMKLLMAFAICLKSSTFDARCSEFFIRKKGMTEARLLREQLIRIIDSQQSKSTDLTKLPALDDTEIAKLKYIIAAGFSDQVAIREDLLEIRQEPGRPPRRTTEVRYRTLLPSTAPHDPQLGPPDKGVFIHPSSVLAELPVSAAPQFVIYNHLSQAATKTIGGRQQRTRMHPLTTVSAKQLAALMEGTALLEVGKPIGTPKLLPYENGKVMRETWVGLSLKGDEVRWPLRERYEKQEKVKGEWRTVKVIHAK